MNLGTIATAWSIPWQPLAFAGWGIMAVLLGPWILGLLYRSRGLVPPSVGARTAGCVLASLAGAAPAAAVLLAFRLVAGATSVPQLALVGDILAAIALAVPGLLLAMRAIGRGGGQSPLTDRLGRLVLAALLTAAGAGFLAVAFSTAQAAQLSARRATDRGRLHAISSALTMYLSQEGEYPRALSQLPDYRPSMPAANLVSANGPHSAGQLPAATSRPYAGPVDFNYIMLPPGAPPDLVWVWLNPSFYDGRRGLFLTKGGAVIDGPPEVLYQRLSETFAYYQQYLWAEPITFEFVPRPRPTTSATGP